jgi:putative proteasome-type protease
VGMKVSEGLVGIADTRITSGNECITAKKVYTYQKDRDSLFLMTSGLRSVRDKAVTYFEELLFSEERKFDRLFKAVNAYAEQIRLVAKEDKEALAESGLTFNIHTLIGGQFEHDPEHKLYMVYPQGNWIEVGQGTPYHIIGSSGYGKPILDRTLNYHDPIHFAFKVGCLAFDSTRISAADVDFPIDIVLYARDSFRIVECRYQKEDLAEVSNWWQEHLRGLINELPSEFIERALVRMANVKGETLALPPLHSAKSML